MNGRPVLVVEDDSALREALCETLKAAGFETLAAEDGRAALEVLSRTPVGLVLADVKMPNMDGDTLLKEIRQRRAELPVVMMTAFGTVQNAVDSMRAGAVDYLVKPFEAELLVSKVAGFILRSGADDEECVAADPRSRAVVELAQRVARSDATVMISGESGTGKEVLARFVHRHSGRADKPFVAVNCAAIPENMLEAMLFGYEKGAFTGAVQACPGKFEQAQGGTLLLDEISEMNLGIQAKLLRVLQEREVERLGGRRAITLDVRVLATTNRILREEVAAGRFREDLFYRLNVFPLHLPPLRERPLDILPLAHHLLAAHARRNGRAAPTLSPEAQERLLRHNWPGNVRELDNLIQRALILQKGKVIEAEDLQFEPDACTPAPVDNTAAPAAQGLSGDLKAREASLILEALKAGNGSRKQAAERLGISPRTLRYKLARMRKAGIVPPG